MKKVITYGTFDLLHQGHINLLRNAKRLGDYLIVGVTSENYDKYRGKLNVRQTVSERIENIRSTGLADEIVVEEYEGQKIDDIKRMGVDVFAIGSDWIGRFDYLKEFCEVVYLERTRGISSTALRDREHPMIRLGIAGSGRIAGRFLLESKFVSGITVEGVFNPHPSSASEFAAKNELLHWSSDYDTFLNEVNAVYIATPHSTHFDYAKRALLAGKHVLCEKPMVFEGMQARELFSLAQERGLILMEAVKTAYCPGFQRMVSCAKSGKIGKIVHVDAAFTKLVAQNSRELSRREDGGSVLELATYPLLAIFELLGTNYRDVRFQSFYGDGAVDLFTRLELLYDGASASAKVGLGVKSEGSLVISGTRGYVYVPAPWWKTDYFELRYENQNETEKDFYKFAGDGLRYELVEFLNRIAARTIDERASGLSVAMAVLMEKYRTGAYTTRI